MINLSELCKKYGVNYHKIYYHIKKNNANLTDEKHFVKFVNDIKTGKFKKEKSSVIFFRINKNLKSKIDEFCKKNKVNLSDGIRNILLTGIEKTSKNKN